MLKLSVPSVSGVPDLERDLLTSGSLHYMFVLSFYMLQ